VVNQSLKNNTIEKRSQIFFHSQCHESLAHAALAISCCVASATA